MAVLTIHDLDKSVEKRIRTKAHRERKSVNRTLKDLLTESVGGAVPATRDHRADFAEFAGVWSAADAREFSAAAADMTVVDDRDWR